MLVVSIWDWSPLVFIATFVPSRVVADSFMFLRQAAVTPWAVLRDRTARNRTAR